MSEQIEVQAAHTNSEPAPSFDAQAEFKSAMSDIRGEKTEPQAAAPVETPAAAEPLASVFFVPLL